MTQSGDSLKATDLDHYAGDRSVVEYTEVEDQECAEFQSKMAERIGAGEDLQEYSHMLTCERCRALVRDLEAIAFAAKELIPIEEEPRDELWQQIQLAIERGDA